MPPSAEIENYLNAVERYAGKRFRHRSAIGTLIDCAAGAGGIASFERIVFLAKFVTGAFDILRRSGAGSEDTRHLVRELNLSMEEVSSLIETLLASRAATDECRRLRERFLTLSQESMEALRDLLMELTWIKQYMLAGNPPPVSAGEHSPL